MELPVGNLPDEHLIVLLEHEARVLGMDSVVLGDRHAIDACAFGRRDRRGVDARYFGLELRGGLLEPAGGEDKVHDRHAVEVVVRARLSHVPGDLHGVAIADVPDGGDIDRIAAIVAQPGEGERQVPPRIRLELEHLEPHPLGNVADIQ